MSQHASHSPLALEELSRSIGNEHRRFPISVSSAYDSANDALATTVVCNDGSIWVSWDNTTGGPRWTRMPDVPQDKPSGLN